MSRSTWYRRRAEKRAQKLAKIERDKQAITEIEK
jgi:hypothetical protein